MLYCELVTVTYRLSSGKRRLVYSISTLSLSLFAIRIGVEREGEWNSRAFSSSFSPQLLPTYIKIFSLYFIF